jgi:serine/threonine protein kinase/WD40 repeat protein
METAVESPEEPGLARAVPRFREAYKERLVGTLTLPTLKIGDRLGSYRILEVLGQGGMGVVYKARHERMARVVVALKVLPPEWLGPQSLARFEREKAAIGRLDHPNIVAARDDGEEDGVHFLVMEYVEGLDLKRLIECRKRLGVAEACGIAKRVADALEYARQNDLVHRDIKPSNVLLTCNGGVKVLDFGIARLLGDHRFGDDLTQPDHFIGSAAYAAPEQASHAHEVDIRADLYSLGCTLYYMLAGRAPFSEHRDPWSKIHAHMYQTAPSIRSIRSDVPEELAEVLDRLLAKKPEDRYTTPADLAAALERFSQGSRLAELAKQTEDSVAERSRDDASTDSPVLGGGSGPSDGPEAKMSLPTQPARRRRRMLPLAMALLGLGGIVAAWQVTVIPGGRKGAGVPPSVLAPPAKVQTPEVKAAGTASGPIPPEPRVPTSPVPAKITPPPTHLKPMNPFALVTRPAPISGLMSWTVEPRRPRERRTDMAFRSIALRPVDNLIAASDGTAIRLIDHDTGRLVRTLVAQGFVRHLAWSPDGRTLGVQEVDFQGQRVSLWDVERGRPSQTINHDGESILGFWQRDLAWSGDSKIIAAAGIHAIMFWEASTGRPIGRLVTDGARHVTWTSDSKRLASAGKKSIQIWDTGSGTCVRTIPTDYYHEALVLSWSPDDSLLASGCLNGRRVSIYDPKTGDLVREMESPRKSYWINALAWSRDGRSLLSASPGTIESWNPLTGALIRTVLSLTDQERADRIEIASMGDGNVAAVSVGGIPRDLHGNRNEALIVWDTRTGEARSTISYRPVINEAAWSPGQSGLATLVFGGSVRLWTIDSNRALSAREPAVHGTFYPPLAWFPSRDHVAVKRGGHEVGLSLIDTGSIEERFLKKPEGSLDLDIIEWSPHGTILALRRGGEEVELFEAKSGKPLRSLAGTDHHLVLAFSRDGTLLATGSSQADRKDSLKIWEVATGRSLVTFQDTVGAFNKLTWSPNGESLATLQQRGQPLDEELLGSEPRMNKMVKVWDIASRKVIRSLDLGDQLDSSPFPITHVLWSQDGQSLTAWTGEGLVRTWDTVSGQLLRKTQWNEGVYGGLREGFYGGAVSPDGRLLASPMTGDLRFYDTETGRHLLTLVPLNDDGFVAISADGYYSASRDLKDDIIYVIQTDQEQKTLTPEEFGKKFGWRNDVTRVRLP